MAASPASRSERRELDRLVQRFADLDPTQRLVDTLRSGRQRAAGGLWGASAGLLFAAIDANIQHPTLIVCADRDDADSLADDIGTFTGTPPAILSEQLRTIDDEVEPQSHGERLRLLHEFAAGNARIVLAPLAALLQPVPRPRALRRNTLPLITGSTIDPSELLQRATQAGLRKVPVVLGPGEISQRGDVVDVYPLGSPLALRLEFFDDELESIRHFEPATQRSLGILEETELVLGGAGEGESSESAAGGHVIEHLYRDGLLIARFEPLRLEDRQQTLLLGDELSQSFRLLEDTIQSLPKVSVSSLPSHDLDFKVLSAGSAVGSGEADPVGRLRSIRGLRGAVQIVCRREEEAARLREIFDHKAVALDSEHVSLQIGALSKGFRLPDLSLTVVSNVEFAGVPAAARVHEKPVIPSRALQSFFELGPGDLVVHQVHGIAKFEGIERVTRGEAVEDHLRLSFKDDVKLFVPASKIHLIQKYVGAGQAAPPLDKLGGKGFAKRKAEVERALFDLASDLLEVQAKRELVQRPPFVADPLEQDFLDGFPFEDTPDQKEAWAEIKQDLERHQPMDRLVCGDVGFGKTELAMRAAFKVAITGRQVAVLVPTTILAEQHGRTFDQRFTPHGLRVEVLSRFRKPAERKQVVQDLARGTVDVVIGTHRILSKDVDFADLGLMVIDEEQRFGVRHKEHLKRLRHGIDVLTLSATPIPRTLHGSMLGLRGISTLATPPPGRQEVETRVAFWRRDIVQKALAHELNRDGQVFVLHNRIDTLEAIRQQIQQLAPEAKIAIGHGQMTEAQTDKMVRGFVRGEFDVLVSTTIVENGIDIPTANTILIDRADRFGLAELHQLRGRVGRSDRHAHCWLFIDQAHPPKPDAKKRLKALEEFSNLGAGFAIAMKDLEIRGAGNLLGPQQSGHIAAVGYELYCQLLRQAVETAKGDIANPIPAIAAEVDVDLQLAAFIPDHFVDEPKARLELLRELDGAGDATAAENIAKSLFDRHGELPVPMQNLLKVFLVEHLLRTASVRGVQLVPPDRIVVRHAPGEPLGGAWLDSFAEIRSVEAGKTHLMLPRRKQPWDGEAALRLLLVALQGEAPTATIERACRRRQRRRKTKRK